MAIALFTLTSFLHAEAACKATEELFIKNIEAELGTRFEFFDNDYSSFGTHELDLIYVRTGGTEGLFKALNLSGEILLLTSGDSNSLAASMEILSYLRQKGQKGEIIHGSPDYIAQRLLNGHGGFKPAESFTRTLPHTDLGGMKLGIIGKPSDWLISSDVNYKKAKDILNVDIIDIPMSELLSILDNNTCDMRSFEGSEAIYDAIKQLISSYKLDGISIRCFDLLDSVHNTGCLALARLNAEGIPASCEGDVPALLSMAYLWKTKKKPAFQCNLSRINGDELLFAHCTVPFNMVSSFKYTTHFESGIGTGIKGEMPLGKVEIFKISPDLETYVSIPAEIVKNENLSNLCRTQILVHATNAADYFLHEPLANHHLISYLD